jgi:sugar phosphate permease
MTSRIHWAWVILSVSLATTFIHYSIRLGYGILMPEMILSLKINKAQAGAIYSSFFLAYTIFSPILGFMIDRFSARLLLGVFSALLAAGTFFMGMPQTLFQACLAFFLAGIGASAMWTPVATLLLRWFTGKRRGLALGILSISSAMGYGIMGLALPLLATDYGWRACWFLLGAGAFLLVPLNGLLLRDRPQELRLGPWGETTDSGSMPLPAESKEGFAYRRILRMPGLYLAGISYFFIGLNAYLVNLFIVTYGALELKYSFARAAQLASSIAFIGIAGALLLPPLSDYIGRKKCLIIINAGMAASALLIIWAGDSRLALLAATGAFGIFYMGVWPVYAALAAEFFPAGATGSVIGFWTIFYGLSVVLAPAVGGYLADATGTFVYSFLTAAVSGGLATLFLLPIKK